jgi:hypothetical protein
MAVLRLELGIDSDVYPELYAKVASLERLEMREEKLRELAATGLIWEVLRLRGADSLRVAPPATPEPPPTGSPSAVDAGTLEDHSPHVPQNVPVLLDVVDEAELARAGLTPAAPDPVPGFAANPPMAPQGVAEAASAASLAQATVTKARSARMKRMKDSGLFQNG